MIAAPRLRSDSAKGWMREWFSISEKGMEGMMGEPTLWMCSTSERRVERRRDQDAVIAGSLCAIRCCLMNAKREGRGVASSGEREAKTEEISPSFRGPRSRGVCVWAAVASVRSTVWG